MTLNNLHADLLTFYNMNSEKFTLVNPLFCLNSATKSLTWNNYQSDEMFDDYKEYYEWVVLHDQYSFAFGEEALVRIYFQDQQPHWTASMAFLPDPSLSSTYFRFDMDSLRKVDFLHSSYHVHFGYNSNRFRISLMSYPYPSQFLYFISFLLGYYECNDFDKSKFFDSLDVLSENYNHFLNLKLNR